MNPTRSGGIEVRTAQSPITRYQTSFIGVESMTRQDQAEMCNINNIYKKTQQGQLSMVSGKAPTFGDFSDVGTYDVILESISAAQEAFMELPSDVRKEFNNDPAQYYEKVTEGAIADAKAKAQALKAEKQAAAEAQALSDAQALIAKNEQSS
ncbi:internal scaffolding protein [Microviridae sp.]|nr:internal scaffolding protein [Microviridae sp.]